MKMNLFNRWQAWRLRRRLAEKIACFYTNGDFETRMLLDQASELVMQAHRKYNRLYWVNRAT